MADHLAPAVARHHRHKLAALDLVPVAVCREHLRVHVVMTIDFEKAAGDRRRIAFVRQIDGIVARFHRLRPARACGVSTADGRGSAAPLKLRWIVISHPSIPCSWQEMPASRLIWPASDTATFENREWPCSKIRVLTSRREHNSAMRARSRSDPGIHSAGQIKAASSAIRLAMDTGTPSASDASRTKARTISPRVGSSTSCSSENREWRGAFTMQTVRMSFKFVDRPILGHAPERNLTLAWGLSISFQPPIARSYPLSRFSRPEGW